MREYDFSGLSTRSFEKMVQALAVGALGTQVSIFGDGPDGGREATFEGRATEPTSRFEWNGYGVLQAKFRQRTTTKVEDAEWLALELKHEQRAYLAPNSRRRKPEYYILASNVVLTPVSDAGTQDKFTTALREFSSALKLKGSVIWHYDHLRSLLDNNDGVRRGYSAFITSGDVLAAMMEWMNCERTDFFDCIANYLAKELINAQYAKLEQAGYVGDDRISLARVFVDAPYSDQWLPTALPDAQQRLFVTDMLEVATDRLDPASCGVVRAKSPTSSSEPEPGRIVLIGGPGQGKTTVGQFICQLFRAAIISQRPPHTLSREVSEALTVLQASCAAHGPAIPRMRRFPLHITLSEFAASLSKVPIDSHNLLEYLTTRISRRTNAAIVASDLRLWLSVYPWLIVFDGLDEVPSSSNRDELLSAIEEFWIDLAQANADVLVIATSRPQGYNDDFSSKYYQHRWLTPLSPTYALRYAERLVAARFRSAEDRADRLMTRLREATALEATARLMRTPLQITIMSTLLDQIGRAPQDRWRLFQEYYQAIYRREMERDTPAAILLAKHHTDVDVIHARVGLRLQAESERRGGTEAAMPMARFRHIVEDRVEEKGYTGEERDSLVRAIIEAAETRLVFLVSPTADSIGFEIRSLQEFMAAQALMSGETAVVQRRLRHIAPAVSWQNVFVFAAGRCFAYEEHLADTVYAICAELNEGLAGELGTLLRVGSTLAIELLEDGIADRQPKYARLLMTVAVDAVMSGLATDLRRLAALYDPAYERLFVETVRTLLHSSYPDVRLAAWVILAPLAERGVIWADQLGTREWPIDDDEAVAICEAGCGESGRKWLAPRALEVMSRLGARHWQLGYSLARDGELLKVRAVPEWFEIIVARIRGTRESAAVAVQLIARGQTWNATMPSLASARRADWEALRLCDWQHETWEAVRALAAFALEPSAATLASAIRSSPIRFPRYTVAPDVPWPAEALLTWARSEAELAALSRLAADGEFGDMEDWLKSEQDWTRGGIELDSLTVTRDDTPPTIEDLRLLALFAIDAARVRLSVDAFSAFYDVYQGMPRGRLRSRFANWLTGTFAHNREAEPTNALTISQLVSLVADIPRDVYANADVLAQVNCEEDELGVFLDAADKLGNRRNVSIYSAPMPTLRRLLEGLEGDSRRTGLLHLLAQVTRTRADAPRLREIARGLDLSAVRPAAYTSAQSIQDALLLWVALGPVRMVDVSDIVAQATAEEQLAIYTPQLLASLLERLPYKFEVAERMLVEMNSRLRSDSRLAAALIYQARQIYARRPSDIESSATMLQLRL